MRWLVGREKVLATAALCLIRLFASDVLLQTLDLCVIIVNLRVTQIGCLIATMVPDRAVNKSYYRN